MVTRVGSQIQILRRTFFKEWREFRGFSQEELAEKIGTTKTTVSRIETGKRPYSQRYLEAAAIALMCQPFDLIARHPERVSLDSIVAHRSEADQKRAEAVLKAAFET